jgi:hypothetical protein
MSIEQELITILNQIAPTIEKAFIAWVQKHPGHGTQKVHGNRYGSSGAAKESLRRLKDDKGEREKYKAKARKKAGMESKPVRISAKQQMLSYAKSRMREGSPNTPEQWLGYMIKEGGIRTKDDKIARARREGKTITITETKRGEKHKIVNGRLVSTPFERTREVLRVNL